MLRMLLQGTIGISLIVAAVLTAPLGDEAEGSRAYVDGQSMGTEGLIAVGLIVAAAAAVFAARRLNRASSQRGRAAISQGDDKLIGVRLDHDHLSDQIDAYASASRRASARIDAAYKERWHPGHRFADNFGLPSPESLAVADRDIREYGGTGTSHRRIGAVRLTDSGSEVIR